MFNRLESPHWQFAFRLAHGTCIQKCLGSTDEAVARLRERMGLSGRAVSFNQAADAWLKELNAEAGAGLRMQCNMIDDTSIVGSQGSLQAVPMQTQ
jgi:hypothetical protein